MAALSQPGRNFEEMEKWPHSQFYISLAPQDLGYLQVPAVEEAHLA